MSFASEISKKAAPTPALTPARNRVLQRNCACGGTPGPTGECAQCRRKRLLGQPKLTVNTPGDRYEQEADRVAEQVMRMPEPGLQREAAPEEEEEELLQTKPLVQRQARGEGGVVAPPIVHEVLRGPSQPLDAETQGFMQRRLGHDFSGVRVHADAEAAASARAVQARAYTVGRDVVFGAGQYAPGTEAGKRLLAHELTHTLQQKQRAIVQRHSIAPDPGYRVDGRVQEDEEEEVEERGASPELQSEDEGGIAVASAPRTLQRIPDDDPFLDDPWPEKTEAAAIRAEVEAQYECIARIGPDPAECDPSRALTWADFTGPAPRGRFGARTFSSLRERPINVGLLRCMPNSAAAQGAPSRAIQAFFNPARSGVKRRFGSQANDPNVNGCARIIRNCQRHMTRLANRGRTGTFSMNSGPIRRCPASVRARGDVATSHAECTTVVGADCNDRSVAESQRLLQHEQGHFDLTCAMARKANAMLATTTNFAGLLAAARRVLTRQQRLYDRQTNHGCRASQQADWETAIADGLPGVTITVGRRRGRRRGRGRGRGGRRRR